MRFLLAAILLVTSLSAFPQVPTDEEKAEQIIAAVEQTMVWECAGIDAADKSDPQTLTMARMLCTIRIVGTVEGHLITISTLKRAPGLEKLRPVWCPTITGGPDELYTNFLAWVVNNPQAYISLKEKLSVPSLYMPAAIAVMLTTTYPCVRGQSV